MYSGHGTPISWPMLLARRAPVLAIASMTRRNLSERTITRILMPQKMPLYSSDTRCPCTPVGIGAVLALDPGMALGWALRTPDGHVTHGTLDLRSRQFEGGGMRFLRFRQWLTEVKTCAGELEAIHFEEVRAHRGVDAAHAYGGLVATLTA